MEVWLDQRSDLGIDKLTAFGGWILRIRRSVMDSIGKSKGFILDVGWC